MRHTLSRCFALTCAGLPLGALAHTGADAGAHHAQAFAMGLLHPFTGIDHVAAMLAVGFWSALVFRGSARRLWAAPLAFVALLVAGAALGTLGWAATAVEPMVAASLLVLGVLVATQARLPVAVGAALAGFFALFHGLAHGLALDAAPALAGMVLGTLSLHVVGLLAGRGIGHRHHWLPRLAGAGVTLLGVGLLSGAL